jgi:hypothetical protein
VPLKNVSKKSKKIVCALWNMTLFVAATTKPMAMLALLNAAASRHTKKESVSDLTQK